MRRLLSFLVSAGIVLHSAAGLCAGGAEKPFGRPASYYVNIGMSNFPSPDTVYERIRIAREVGFDQMTQYPEVRPDLQIAARMDPQLWEFHRLDVEQTLRSEIRMTYAELSSLRMQAEAVRWSRDVFREVVEIARRLYLVGKGSQADVLKSQLEQARLQESLLTTENQVRLAEIRLNLICGLPVEEPVPRLEELEEFPFPHTEEELMRTYVDSRQVRLAITMSILRGRNMSNVRDLRTVQWLDNEARTLIYSNLSTLRTRAAQISLYRSSVLPQAEQAFQGVMESYRVGRAAFPALIESVRDLLSYRKEYYTILGDRHLRRAKLESVVGKDL